MYGEDVYKTQSVAESMAKVVQRIKEIERFVADQEYPEEVEAEIRIKWQRMAQPTILSPVSGVDALALQRQQAQAYSALRSVHSPGNSLFGNLFNGLF